ncbi:cbb3-type cytochrome c oxidase subunit I [Rhizobiaceae bacterium n13]|uniref:Cbb3-type cytochrome c oxidase subunit I n=1 Tax=Ferirhizobium litorale TaxID=2927786 RepID=A0AAE3U3P6_9HYPH|nr:hypothetical protein [Fererhizobium litorale]MDI7862109.1 cbb3-type cytochrome c oxidase subunit I [Fererhizobium litorale]MDI7922618.1 cbb3-type cytochrome c oxidase subunit I [Fererhizobium litorale]
MPKIAHLYFKSAVIFFLAGIIVGLKMAISGNHDVIPAHAHINLLGWVSCAIIGAYFAFCPAKAEKRLAMLQFGLYVTSVAMISIALYLMGVGYPQIEPLAAFGSILTLVAALMFAFIVFSPDTAPASSLGLGSRATP